MSQIAIVGGGIIGLCSAYELIKSGHEVTVIERNFEDGCSYGNGGIIVPSHFVPIASPSMLKLGLKTMLNPRGPFGLSQMPDFEILSWMLKYWSACHPGKVSQSSSLLARLNLESKAAYRDLLQNVSIDCGFEENGLLLLCTTESGLHEEAEMCEPARQLGLSTEVLNRNEVRNMIPAATDEVKGAVWFKDDAHLTPRTVMSSLRDYLRSKGVRFENQNVEKLVLRDREVKSLESNQASLEADQFVFCAGAWTGALASQVGLKMPMLSGRGYGITRPPSDLQLKYPAILVEARIAVTPMLDGTRFVGALELGHPNDRSIGPRFEAMTEAIPDYIGDGTSEDLRKLDVWTGHRPCTPDGLPYIGISDKAHNVCWAAGHAMMGMSLGPVSGKMVAKLLQGDTAIPGAELLSPDRYA